MAFIQLALVSATGQYEPPVSLCAKELTDFYYQMLMIGTKFNVLLKSSQV